MSQQKAQLISPIDTFTPPGLNVSGVVTSTSFVGSGGTVTGLSGTPNITLGVVTATTYSGDGSNLTGVGSSAFVGQSTTSQSPTTTIDLSLGNVIYFTHDTDTTVAFANTSSVERVKFIRTKDDSATVRTITWPANLYWDGNTTPTLINSSQPEDAQIFNLTTRDQGVTWYGYEEFSYTPPVPYELWVWGNGSNGRLAQNDTVPRSSPTQISGTQWNNASHSIGDTTIATKTDETLWGWGSNSNGQIGLNDTVARSSPHQIPGTQWEKGFSGYLYTLAIKSDNTLWSWGRNTFGGLGLNDVANRSSPTQIPGTQWRLDSYSSWIATSLLKTDGTLWVWGYNTDYGDLGLNSTIDRSSPTQIPGTQWSSISGFYYSKYALKTDGTLWAWGFNSSGALGVNDGIVYSSPRQIPGTQWNSVYGSDGAIATKTDGTLWVWGRNGNGQLGINDRINRSSPHQIPGTQWATQNWFGSSNNAYLKTDGTLYMSGSNGNGQLGLNSTIDRSSPTQVPGSVWRNPYTWDSTIAIKQA